MSAVAAKPRAKRASPTSSVSAAEADFARGRDIAINMINEGAALCSERDCFRRHREPGTAQDNFVSGYLSDVIDEPKLRAGFTAVLSQLVGAGESFDGAYFKDLTLADTMAGDTDAESAISSGQALRAAKRESASPPLSATPADAVARINEEVARAMALISEAVKEISDDDSVRMLLLVSKHCLPELLAGVQPDMHHADSVHGAMERYHDAAALMTAVAGRHEGEENAADVRKAITVLSPIYYEMDRLNFWPTEVVASTQCAVKQSKPSDEFDPYCVMKQALKVVRAAVSEANASTDMYWGLFSLVEKGLEHVDRAQAALEADTFSKDLHDSASNELAGLLGVLNAVNTDAVDDTLLYAVETLVIVAKNAIDSANTGAPA